MARRYARQLALVGLLVVLLAVPFAWSWLQGLSGGETAPGAAQAFPTPGLPTGPSMSAAARQAAEPAATGGESPDAAAGPSSQTGQAAVQSEVAAEAPPDSAGEGSTGPTFLALAGGSTVSPKVFHSAVLNQQTWYQVILPPGYESSGRRYPVLYLLHGAMGGANEWVEIGIHRAADELWARGLEPFIIVLPEGGQLTYWLNHANDGPRYEDYLLRDVVGEIDARYRTIADPRHRAIGGLSMGGDGALRLALVHPDVFGIAGAHSPTTRLKYEDRPGPFYGDLKYWQRNNSLWLIKNADVPEGIKIWIDVGEADPWVFSARELHKALLDKSVEHRYLEHPGTHEAEYWIANQDEYLQFYASSFGSQALAGRPEITR